MLVEVVSVSVSFGERHVLEEACLDVEEGSSVAIVGPSGSGKSTLAFCIAGVLKPDSGYIRIAGEDAFKSGEAAFIQQTTNAIGSRSCRENIAMGSLAGGATRREALLDADVAMTQVGLSSVASHRAHRLSGGELQRTAIARALVMNARVIVADEPTGQLDETTSRSIIDVLLSTVTSRRALVLVTHDLVAAHRCDRVLRLSNGRLLDADR